MLRPKVLARVLEQLNTDGVTSSMMLHPDGSLLASSVLRSGPLKPTLVAAVCANAWSTFDNAKPTSTDELRMMLMDFENGRVAISRVSDRLLLLVVAEAAVQPGLLRAKVDSVRAYLSEALRSLE